MQSEMAQRLEGIQARMAAACQRAGRKVDEVRLVAVSKTFGPERVAEAAELGLDVFGESRVQEAGAKIEQCRGGLSWHFIGHLQTNKVRHAVELFDMVHAVDSLKLLNAVEAAAEESGRRIQACIEVNVSGERSKYGLKPEELQAILERAANLNRVQVVGLMTIPPLDKDPAAARPYFARLRELRDAGRLSSGLPMPVLSMGMTHDFEVAIEEGATWVRIGSGLFGERRGSWQRMQGDGTDG